MASAAGRHGSSAIAVHGLRLDADQLHITTKALIQRGLSLGLTYQLNTKNTRLAVGADVFLGYVQGHLEQKPDAFQR